MAGYGTTSGEDTGLAASESDAQATSAAATPVVDEAAPDTGDFPVTPSEPFGRATNDNILEIESHRMAEFVTPHWESRSWRDSSPPRSSDSDSARSRATTYSRHCPWRPGSHRSRWWSSGWGSCSARPASGSEPS